jgi:hypothetical protein
MHLALWWRWRGLMQAASIVFLVRHDEAKFIKIKGLTG